MKKFSGIPIKLLNRIDELKDTIREMPTEYFETKFKRVVQPNEFKYAVVPDNTSVKTIGAMEKDGLKVVKYKANDYADRLNKIKTLKKITAFSLLLGLMGYQKQKED